jgi:hypothetical protein
MIEWDIDPAFRLCELERREWYQVMIACTCKQSDSCRSIGLIGFKIEEDTNRNDRDET